MFNQDEYKRYNRNIIIQNIGINGQKKLLQSKVLVCGAGGLGSAVMAALASLGVGSIGIIDNDKVEISNLNRQFIHKPENLDKNKVDSAKEWINNYNPEINVQAYPTRLTENNTDEILRDYNIVIDCFDSFQSKFIINDACIKNNKILIHGGVTELFGQVMTIIPGKSACLRCLFSEFNENLLDDEISGVLSPVVNIIGSIQALEVVKVLLNFDSILVNCILSYDGMEQTLKKMKIIQNNNCSLCSRILA